MAWHDGKSSSSAQYYQVRRRKSPSRHSTYSTTTQKPASVISDLFSQSGRGSRTAPSVLSSSSKSHSRRARPRPGYWKRLVHYVKRLFRKIYLYARHHPYKVFLLVILPLITGGVLQKLLSMVGVYLSSNTLRGLTGRAPNASRAGQAKSVGDALRESLVGLMGIVKMLL